MKKFLKSIVMILVTFIIFISSVNVYGAVESNDDNDYIERYENILKTMKKSMENVSTTGDATVDFLYQMIPYHEAAVYMSEDILKYGSNDDVKSIAKTIVSKESDEITNMQNLLRSLKDNLKIDIDRETEYLKVYKDAYKKMISQMESVKADQSIDKHFLQAMIFHDEGAIKIAESISQHTYNDEVKKMAEDIVQSQISRINEMKNLMEKIK